TGVTRLSGPSRGGANAAALVGPVVINEVMYHPPDPDLGITVDTEFVELYNAGDSAVDLYSDFSDYGVHPWKLRGGIGFEFPVGTTMVADSYLLVVNFDPANATLLAEFRAVYGLDGTTTILGPYSGQLNNFTDTVRLRKPDSPNPLGNNCGSNTPAAEYAPRVIVEEVSYFDSGDWPTAADGQGASLERADPDLLAELVSSWSANLDGSATPGQANSTLSPPTNAQEKCINALNKDFSKVAKTQGKLDYACAKNTAKDKLEGMTADQCLAADPRGKLAGIQAKTERDFTRSCSGQDRDGNSVYPRFGASDAATANAAAISAPIALMGDAFGDSLDDALVSADSERDMSKCQLAVTKTLHKCLGTTLGIFNKCKKEGLKDGEMRRTRDLAECVGKDNRGKIAKVCSATTGKIARDLERKCEGKGVDLSQALPGCAMANTADAAACLSRAAACRACLALGSADALSADCDAVDDGLANDSCSGG
ncbi:MAG: lamin tail domain-containing protein, partial [Deltaproteobacteria bacterium]